MNLDMDDVEFDENFDPIGIVLVGVVEKDKLGYDIPRTEEIQTFFQVGKSELEEGFDLTIDQALSICGIIRATVDIEVDRMLKEVEPDAKRRLVIQTQYMKHYRDARWRAKTSKSFLKFKDYPKTDRLRDRST